MMNVKETKNNIDSYWTWLDANEGGCTQDEVYEWINILKRVQQFHDKLILIREGYDFIDNVTGLLPDQSARYEQICALLCNWEELNL